MTLIDSILKTRLGAAMLGFGLWGLRPASGRQWARGLFYATLVYLPVLLSLLFV